MKNNVSASPRKKTSQEILRLLEILQNHWKKQRFQQPGRQVPGSEAMRTPAARPGITMPYLENQWKIIVFACPDRCNTVQSAESLCAAWEILVIGKPLEPIGKTSLDAMPWRIAFYLINPIENE